jgi:hypothetical protein
MIHFCCDRRRRNEVDAHTSLNGIDYLEVLDQEAPAGSPRQQTLLVRCLKPIPALDRDNVRIDGGDRIRNVGTVWAHPANAVPSSVVNAGEQAFLAALAEPDRVLVVRTDSSGDYSVYTLVLQKSATDTSLHNDFDPRMATIDFSFKVECPSDFDCKPRRDCPPDPVSEPEIDYLAKDYASFRRLMLDRMSLLMPGWRERCPADLGIMLVELLAHVGDQLSYQQDAVATEAYLGTARRRTSVRRHARLVDYRISDGSNARTWVQIQVSTDVRKSIASGPAVPARTKLLTRIPDQQRTVADDPRIYLQAETVFETMATVDDLFAAHNRMPFYTWSDQDCCLPAGSTRATLKSHYPDLAAGQVVMLEEVLGPATGHPDDADPAHRHPLRLTKVEAFDTSNQPLTDPVTGQQITKIEWAEADALPFALCLSARIDDDYLPEVSVACGNVVPADHGLEISAEKLGAVPRRSIFLPSRTSDDRCQPSTPEAVPPRFNPKLAERPLTQAGPYRPSAPARLSLAWPDREVGPAIRLRSKLGSDTATWYPRQDLLASGKQSRELVVEVESDGAARLRFGDGIHGARPVAETELEATYRVGNGSAGNIGAEALYHIVSPHSEIVEVRNPMPACGGVDPESIKDVRQLAPQAFRTQERAVTPSDYSEKTELLDGVQEAESTFRWTGSWHTVFVTVDRLGGLEVETSFEEKVRKHLERFRMAGHDLEVDGPRPVALEIEMEVCVDRNHFRSDVLAELEQVLGSRDLPDGRRGVFHPDSFTFGQTVYLSHVYAAAQSVPGVSSVHITRFQRKDEPETEASKDGRLAIERLEIAQLDNDPNYPDRGVLRIKLEGGK